MAMISAVGTTDNGPSHCQINIGDICGTFSQRKLKKAKQTLGSCDVLVLKHLANPRHDQLKSNFLSVEEIPTGTI